MKFKNKLVILLSSLSIFSASCTQSGYQVNFNSIYNYTAVPGVIGGNVMPLTVGAAYTNSLTTYVNIWDSGSSSYKTIGPLLVDTGSTGLRVAQSELASKLTAGGLSSLTTSTDVYGNVLGTCVVYGDASYHWGAVKTASVLLGGVGGLYESVVSMPIQAIDYTFGDAGAKCQQSAGMVVHQDTFTANYVGILGIKFFKQDCGSACLSNAGNTIPSYFGCTAATSATCGMVAVALVSQLQNPIAMLAGDNNGYVVDLPAIASTGQTSVTGSLILGVGTQSNNSVPNTVTKLVADPTYGAIAAVFNGSTIPAIIDSGSNANFFQYSSGTLCSGSPYSAFFCPTTSWNFSVKLLGYIGSTYINTSVPAGNYCTLVYGNSTCSLGAFVGNGVAFNNIAGVIPAGLAGTFDLGLPFFFGKRIYYGMEKSATSLGDGPFIAF